MKPKTTQPFESKTASIYRSNLPRFRIRSTSKEKCLSARKKQKENSFEEIEDENKMEKHNAFEKFKISHKQLKKIFIHSRHQRRKSSDIQNSAPRFMQTLEHPQQNKNFLNSEICPFKNDDKIKKPIYQSVRTQESQVQNKAWVDINSIDTAEDIKILDRITTLCDPFRIINQCRSKKIIQQKSKQHRFKSMSAKKSKLAQKINNFVFEMASKSKQKSGSEFHQKKFQPISTRNSLNKHNLQQSGDPQNQKNSFRKQTSSPKLVHIKSVSPKNAQKASELSSKPVQKSLPLQKYSKNLLLPTSQAKQKHKINIKQHKESKKNELMDKFWSGVNQSLILAAQEQYISKDLNQLLYNDMC